MQGNAWCAPRLLASPQPLLERQAAPAPELAQACSGTVIVTGALTKPLPIALPPLLFCIFTRIFLPRRLTGLLHSL